jgi:hypothetical protein
LEIPVFGESAMSSKIKSFNATLPLLLLLLILMAASSLLGQEGAVDLTGTWTGKFVSKNPEFPPFTITVVINSDSNGNLVGKSTLNSRCLKHAQLKVMFEGSKIVLAGSDQQGDNITLRGTLDDTGAILKSAYILDGSATGRCETDDGTGTLTKQ